MADASESPVGAKWACLLLIGLGCGCVPTSPADHARHWCELRVQPLVRQSTPGFAETMRHWADAAPWTRIAVGSFVGYQSKGDAVLYNAFGNPVWAGAYIVPIRKDNRVHGVLLLEDDLATMPGERSDRWPTYRILYMPLDTQKASWLWNGFMKVTDPSLYREGWVLDLNGDNSDEFVIMSSFNPDPGKASDATQDWLVMVFSTSRAGMAQPTSLFDEPTEEPREPQDVLTEIPFPGGLHEILEFSLPPGAAPGGIAFKPAPDGRGALVMCDDGDKPSTRLGWLGIDPKTKAYEFSLEP